MASTQKEETKNRPQSKKSDFLPSVHQQQPDKFRKFKIYRTPPTPPPEILTAREKSFTLDCNAVSHISYDYSTANPKLGSAIPPYNSMDDKAARSYFQSNGVQKTLEKTNILDNPESIAGKSHDNFFKSGPGFQYLQKRNQFGNGHFPEEYEGHKRYMGDNSRVMISYNNMNGYRRNIPKLRHEPPSSFNFDPRWYERIMKTYKKGYTDDELMEHYKNTYIIGYPFWDNNYNNFHPSCKYVITVKIGEHSPAEYEGNLGINIVSRHFDTGFIKLDKNILRKEKKKEEDSDDDADDNENDEKDENSEKKTGKKKKNSKTTRKYELELKTSDDLLAGTDAQVKLTLIGKKQTIHVDLNKDISATENKDLFEKGKMDKFKFEGNKVGKIKKIVIGHDGRGAAPDWKIESVKLIANKKTHCFTVNQWINKKITKLELVEDKPNNQRKDVNDGKGEEDKNALFKRGQKNVFEFEDRDIRSINAIILSKDVKGEEVLFVEWVEVEINKSGERQVYRFPFDSWLRTAKQDKKSEDTKSRFGKTNSLIAYPNEKPAFEYLIKVSPKLDGGNSGGQIEYKIEVDYQIKDAHLQEPFTIQFSSRTGDLPRNGKLIVKLNGTGGESEVFSFTDKTERSDENNLEFKIKNRDIGDLKSACLLYDDLKKNNEDAFPITSFMVTDPENKVYLFDLEKQLKPNKEVTIKAQRKETDKKRDDDDEISRSKSPKNKPEQHDDAHVLLMKLEGQSGENIKAFKLEKPAESKKSALVYTRKDAFISTIKTAIVKYEGEKDKCCKIRAIKISSSLGHYFTFRKTAILRNGEELAANDKSEDRPVVKSQAKKTGQIMVQVEGETKATEFFPLKNACDDEENADVDVFKAIDSDLGKIEHVIVKYNDHKDSDNQVQFNYIEIIDPKGDSYKYAMDMNLKSGEEVSLPRGKEKSVSAKKKVTSKKGQNQNHKHQTLTKPDANAHKKDDRKTSVAPKREQQTASEGAQKYDIEVKTSDEMGSGTDAKIKLSLVGAEKTIELNLDKAISTSSNKDLFEKGQVDKFSVSQSKIGKLQKIVVGHDGSGLAPDWKLDSIKVVLNQETHTFTVNKWLDKQNTQVELEPDSEDRKLSVTSKKDETRKESVLTNNSTKK